MELSEANKLLEPGYLPIETGYARLPGGVMLVAALHRLVGCNVEMLRWWFQRRKTPEEFRRWHPTEHGLSEYRDGVLYVEHLRAGRIFKGRTQSCPAEELFGEDALGGAEATVLSCGRGGPAEADFWSTRMVHVGRDQDWGCEVRSRFWIGVFDPPAAEIPIGIRERLLSERNAAWQMIHCIEEFHHLSTFLPELFAAQQRRATQLS